jgi:hypothetical protein
MTYDRVVEAPSASVLDQPARPAGVFWPIALWLAIQGGALVLAAARVPLSARYPGPEELLGVHLTMIVQVTASAMLFPVLLRSVSSWIIAVAATVPFLQLSAFLAALTDNQRVAFCSLYVAGWLTALGIANAVLRTMAAKMCGVALATLAAVGGAMLAYLHREFSAPSASFEWADHGWLGPIMGCLAILEGDPGAGRIWIFLGAALSAAVLVLGIKWGRRKMALAKRNSAPPVTTCNPPA